ncbi:MAG: hypothetical protein F6K19_03060 [Cyanothece sp. SIO1E1]|nr:hypothetical protein [Cyanothece sp. SIO1E1]
MTTMGKYCKAYPIEQFRQFEQWIEKADNARKETKKVDDQDLEVVRELTSDDFLYLQENYVVTDGIFIDENIIFDNITPAWKAFCNNTLKFEIPVYEPVEVKEE